MLGAARQAAGQGIIEIQRFKSAILFRGCSLEVEWSYSGASLEPSAGELTWV
jgi:hypothetical protein